MAKILFENEDEIKTFSDKAKLRELIVSRCALQKKEKILPCEVACAEGKWHQMKI